MAEIYAVLVLRGFAEMHEILQCCRVARLCRVWQNQIFLRNIHEAYQFIVQKKKKLTGRTMKENWSISRRKTLAVGLLTYNEDKNIEEENGITRSRSQSLASLSQIDSNLNR